MREFLILLVGIMFVLNTPTHANSDLVYPFSSIEQDSLSALPKVFLLGNHEIAYEKLSGEGTSLLAICEDDFKAAHGKWNSLLKEMEAHAEMINYDIKGVKMWLHVFWDDNGKINNIAFYLKPNSRNVKTEEMTAFLTDFVNNYHLPAQYDNSFSHYSGAAFPTLNWKKKRKITTTAKVKEKD
ncbi:MAG: hypothetical protein AB8H03_15530 [Saprospiraceae bacterium]